MEVTQFIDDEKVLEAMIVQGVEYAVAEDKAFMAHDARAEAEAHGGREATEKALALFMGTNQAHAAEMINNRL